jgi:hypothetical protein
MLNILGWFGTVTSVIGSFVVSFGFMFPGFILFSLGSISWLAVAYYRKDKALFTLNFCFFVANIIGLVRNF